MMAGMLLAIFTYRPIFNTFLVDSRIDEGLIQSYGQIDESKEVRKVEILKITKDSVITVSRQLTLPDGWHFTKIYTDTIFSNKEKLPVTSKIKYIDVKLNNETYFSFIWLVFLLILYVTMVYGPIAAF